MTREQQLFKTNPHIIDRTTKAKYASFRVEKHMRIYLTDKQALAYFQQQASPDFWDSHWRIEDLQSYLRGYKSDNLFIPLVKRYLPAGKIILEGGCGRGQLVYALQYHGYLAIGIDFAARTV